MSIPLRFITSENTPITHTPWGPHEWLSRSDLTQSNGLMLVRVLMPPGKAHQFHRHPEMEEIIYVISGMAEQWVDNEKRTLNAGDSAYIPADVVHGTYNAGSDTLVFLAILSPSESQGPVVVDEFENEPWRSLRSPMQVD